MKFILPINVVGILTFISRINTAFGSNLCLLAFSFYEQLVEIAYSGGIELSM